MRIVSTTALGLALAFGMAAVTPAIAKDKPVKAAPANYSQKVREAVVAAQAALKANDLPTATAKIGEGEAAIATDDDRLVVGQIYVSIAQKNNDQTLFSKGITLMIASNKAPPEVLPQLLAAKGKIAYSAKDYAGAEQSLLAARTAGSTDADLLPVLVESMHMQRKDLESLQTLNAGIQQRLTAGQTVEDAWFQRGIAIGYQAKPANPADKAAINQIVSELTNKWITAYPTKGHWRDTLLIYRDNNRIDPDQEIDMLRLLRTAGAMNGERDYMDYVLATYLRYPGEAKAVLDEGVAAGYVNVATNKNAAEIKGIVNTKIPADKASLPAGEKSARAAATGKIALSTADAYLGYGEWAKAIDLYKVALAKGGVDAGVVNTRMGIALAKSGDKEGARAAFAAVTGPRKPLADFWTVYLDHPATA